jgi:hypothetical protein
MLEGVRHQAVSQAMLEAGEVPGTQEVAVSFADIVAFTRLGEAIGPEAVATIAGRPKPNPVRWSAPRSSAMPPAKCAGGRRWAHARSRASMTRFELFRAEAEN